MKTFIHRSDTVDIDRIQIYVYKRLKSCTTNSQHIKSGVLEVQLSDL